MFVKRSIRTKNFNSKWEMKIFKSLNSVLPISLQPIKVNKRIPGFRLELDFYIPKLNIAFELQGPLHILHLKNIRRDLYKQRICKKLGINIIYLMPNKSYSKKYFRNVLNVYNKNGTI